MTVCDLTKGISVAAWDVDLRTICHEKLVHGQVATGQFPRTKCHGQQGCFTISPSRDHLSAVGNQLFQVLSGTHTKTKNSSNLNKWAIIM